ncbi:ipt1p [Saccharomyces arboricola H-6]|uniref:Ipt1p n=1 Tax=Saccharomyces arboricola (strain H-6 / AS 2.3317 / CBS 10644) TaxID=1160507 RepID=J8Q3M7_SACAR|nr:ipt1p [Saccharomyces arboricola H-6]
MSIVLSLATFVKNMYNAGLNQRNLISMPFNFMLNFAPVFIWLSIFKHAGMIPISIRPDIHSKFAFFADQFLFGDYWRELSVQCPDNASKLVFWSFVTSSAFLLAFLVGLPFAIWYYIYYVKRVKYNPLEWFANIFHSPRNDKQRPIHKRFRTIFIPFALPLFTFVILNIDHLFAYQSDANFTKTKDLLAWFSYVILHITAPILTAVYLYIFQPPGTLKCFGFALGLQNIAGVFTHLLVPMASPWFTHLYGINDTEHVNYTQEGFAAGLVRVDSHLGTHLNTKGFHMSPIVFGAVPSLHSAIAFQCVLFLISRSTSLKHRFSNRRNLTMHNDDFSTLKLNEDDSEDDTDNHAALMVGPNDLEMEPLGNVESVDILDERSPSPSPSFSVSSNERNTSNTNSNSGKKPLQFVHLYNEDTEFTNKWIFKIINEGLVPKFWAILYITLQWWATMYLDHHYRFDLFVGVLYAMTSFIIINWFVLQPKVLKHWIHLRIGDKADTRNEARTFGMRVFCGTKMEWFFDPLA